MKRFFFLLSTAALGLAAYLILKDSEWTATAEAPDDLDRLRSRVGRWGTKQRLTGAGSSLAGNVEQTAGDLVGSDQLANQGAFDQTKGAVKDAAGQVAHAVEDTIHDLHP